jgi:hypothetical protein
MEASVCVFDRPSGREQRNPRLQYLRPEALWVASDIAEASEREYLTRFLDR